MILPGLNKLYGSKDCLIWRMRLINLLANLLSEILGARDADAMFAGTTFL